MQTSVDKKKILIGERIFYNIQFTFPDKNFSVEFNVPDSVDHFEIMGKQVTDTVVDNKYVVRQQMILTSWDSGRWVIPSFPIKLRNVNNHSNVYNLSSPIHTIDVGYTPMDSTDQLRDIKPVLPVKVAEKKWWYWVAALIAGLILLYLLYKILKRRKKSAPVFESSLTPYQEAMKDLDELEKFDLVNKVQIKQYHVAVSDIFKKYISRKKNSSYMHFTTGEILQLLKQDELSHDRLTDVASGLRGADAVKFAKFEPLPNQSKSVLQSIRSAIEAIEKNNEIK